MRGPGDTIVHSRLRERAVLASGEIAFDVLGTGPPLVLIHGTPSWSYLWRTVVPTLAEESTVYLFDLLGYGDSARSDGQDISIVAQARILAELLDFWQLKMPAVAGHDIGGAVVLRTHLLEHRPFRRLALVDAVVFRPWITPTTRHQQALLEAYATMPAHIYEQVVAAHIRTAAYHSMPEEILAAYVAQWQGPSGQRTWYQKIAQFDEQHTAEFEPLLGSIQVPVLVIWGEQDAWLDVKYAKRLAQIIPGAEVRLIPEAGHFVMEDAPGPVAQALAQFFTPDRRAVPDSGESR